MWLGLPGKWGSRKYLMASLDPVNPAHGHGLRRYFLLAPPDPGTPLEENPSARWNRSSAPARRTMQVSAATPARSPMKRATWWSRKTGGPSRSTSHCLTAARSARVNKTSFQWRKNAASESSHSHRSQTASSPRNTSTACPTRISRAATDFWSGERREEHH